MKKCSRILLVIPAVLSAVLSLLFLFVEGWTIFAGDWLLHEQPVVGLIQYLLRFAAAAGGFAVSLRLHRCGLTALLCLTASCAVMAPLVPNGFGVVFLILAVTAVLLKLLNLSAERHCQK